MLGKALKIGSNFDVISVVQALVGDLSNGPKVIFFVPFGRGWSGNQVRKLLESKGIYVWGLRINGADITFRIRESQARYAAYWLQRHRIPFDASSSLSLGRPSTTEPGSGQRSFNKSIDDPKLAHRTGAKQSGPLDGVLNSIDRLSDKI